jgi:signal transduction histidine kinase/ActR/RegA family two-component response regulator
VRGVRRITGIPISKGYASRLRDIFYALTILTGTIGLFAVDISFPRGVVDGVGYAAVVALASRFGQRTLIATAAITTVLTLIAAGLVPDAGISVGGMWANRACAIASIWIVALIMRSRMTLELKIQERESRVRQHEAALQDMVRHGLSTEASLAERLRFVCQVGAQALGATVGLIGLRNEDDQTVTVLQGWREPPLPLVRPPGSIIREDPNHKSRLLAEFVVATEDMEMSDLQPYTKQAIREHGIRATLAAEIFHGSPRSGTIWFGRQEPHSWTEEEIAFARSVASLVALLFSTQRNEDTLAALELTDEGIYTEDEAGKVLYANRAARDFARTSAQGEELPRPAGPFVGSHDRHEIRFDGRDLEIFRTRLPGGGLIARLTDVTERNLVQQEKAHLETRLQQVAKMEAIGQLAGGIAHDFSNILSAIMGFARFLEEDLTAGSQEQGFARRILAACERGKRLVDQVLDFAMAKTASQDRVELGSVIRQCEEHLQPALRPGIKLMVETGDAPTYVTGSAIQLSQIIVNLCANARDAIGGNDGEICVRLSHADRRELESAAAGASGFWTGDIDPARSYACIRVSDTGDGIAPENLSRIFEPFFTTKSRQRGTGLGLAVVHGAVAAHKGAVHARSEPGAGTIVSIYLPLCDAGFVRPAEMENTALSGNERVLLVDDEADIVEIMSRGLVRLGYQAIGTTDPADVLRAVENSGSDWDIVVTDQVMPGLGGLELIRKIKVLEPGLLAVLCTGYGEAADEQSALKAGADAYVRKPVSAEALARCIRRLRSPRQNLPPLSESPK